MHGLNVTNDTAQLNPDQLLILKEFILTPLSELHAFLELHSEILLTDEAERELKNCWGYHFEMHIRLIKECRKYGIAEGLERLEERLWGISN
jgi:hypothetical protein